MKLSDETKSFAARRAQAIWEANSKREAAEDRARKLAAWLALTLFALVLAVGVLG